MNKAERDTLAYHLTELSIYREKMNDDFLVLPEYAEHARQHEAWIVKAVALKETDDPMFAQDAREFVRNFGVPVKGITK